jgi:hypothetical protein
VKGKIKMDSKRREYAELLFAGKIRIFRNTLKGNR